MPTGAPAWAELDALLLASPPLTSAAGRLFGSFEAELALSVRGAAAEVAVARLPNPLGGEPEAFVDAPAVPRTLSVRTPALSRGGRAALVPELAPAVPSLLVVAVGVVPEAPAPATFAVPAVEAVLAAAPVPVAAPLPLAALPVGEGFAVEPAATKVLPPELPARIAGAAFDPDLGVVAEDAKVGLVLEPSVLAPALPAVPGGPGGLDTVPVPALGRGGGAPAELLLVAPTAGGLVAVLVPAPTTGGPGGLGDDFEDTAGGLGTVPVPIAGAELLADVIGAPASPAAPALALVPAPPFSEAPEAEAEAPPAFGLSRSPRPRLLAAEGGTAE